MLKELLEDLSLVVTKSKNFTHKSEIKSGLFSMFSKEEKEESSLYDFIKIFPPSIHSIFLKYSEVTKNQISDSLLNIEDHYIDYFLQQPVCPLQELCLVKTNMGHSGCRTIAQGLVNFTSLKKLSIDCNMYFDCVSDILNSLKHNFLLE